MVQVPPREEKTPIGCREVCLLEDAETAARARTVIARRKDSALRAPILEFSAPMSRSPWQRRTVCSAVTNIPYQDLC